MQYNMIYIGTYNVIQHKSVFVLARTCARNGCAIIIFLTINIVNETKVHIMLYTYMFRIIPIN